MDFAFILDPLSELKAYKDSSVAMMRELARRGHRLFAMEQGDLFWDAGVTRARARPLELFEDDHAWYREGAADVMRLTDFAAVIMRKDPPFDMEYVYSTYLLECAEHEGARIFNRPRAIRDHNEKMAIAKFPDFIAPTLVTRDGELIAQFIDEHEDVVIKPLDGMGGTSVFRITRIGSESQRHRRDRVAPRTADGHGAAVPARNRRRRQAHPADRRRRSCRIASRAFPSRAKRAATWPRAAAAKPGR